MRLLRPLLALLLGATALPAQSPAAGGTTVLLVRHGEKAAEPAGDPPLTAVGAARAESLAELVKDAGVSAVISTGFARTRGTAAPSAARLGLTTEIVDARAPDHPRQVAEGILARHRGETVLVVGHSNTIPAIAAALGAPEPPALCDGDYDNLYIVTVPATGKARIVRARYGAPARDEKCGTMKP
jgi:broad specificity phosphatase PhoE